MNDEIEGSGTDNTPIYFGSTPIDNFLQLEDDWALQVFLNLLNHRDSEGKLYGSYSDKADKKYLENLANAAIEISAKLRAGQQQTESSPDIKQIIMGVIEEQKRPGGLLG